MAADTRSRMNNARFQEYLEVWANEIETEIAKRQMKIANKAKDMLQSRLSRPYPPASKRNTYPKMRTGTLHDSVKVFPDSVQECKELGGEATILYDESGFYGYILASPKFDRKGPEDLLATRELANYAQSVMNQPITA